MKLVVQAYLTHRVMNEKFIFSIIFYAFNLYKELPSSVPAIISLIPSEDMLNAVIPSSIVEDLVSQAFLIGRKIPFVFVPEQYQSMRARMAPGLTCYTTDYPSAGCIT